MEQTSENFCVWICTLNFYDFPKTTFLLILIQTNNEKKSQFFLNIIVRPLHHCSFHLPSHLTCQLPSYLPSLLPSHLCYLLPSHQTRHIVYQLFSHLPFHLPTTMPTTIALTSSPSLLPSHQPSHLCFILLPHYLCTYP